MKRVISLKRGIILSVLLLFAASGVAIAAPNSEFAQVINAGTLTTDILDTDRSAVASPGVSMTAQNFSFDCQTSTGTFGTNAQRVYVINPSAANSGWTLTVAATGGASALWENAGSSASIDFNDAAGSGCTNGQMTIDPDAGTLTADCATCSTSNISKGSSAAFNQGTTDNITLLNAASSSDNVWRGYLTGVGVSQEIPGETEADTYTLDLTLTATAQ